MTPHWATISPEDAQRYLDLSAELLDPDLVKAMAKATAPREDPTLRLLRRWEAKHRTIRADDGSEGVVRRREPPGP